MFNKRLLLGVLFIFLSISGLAVFIISLLTPPVPRIQPVNNKPAVKDDIVNKIFVKFPGAEAGSYWELQVTKLENLNEYGNVTAISGRYIQNGKPFYHIKANSGKIYWENHILKVNGSVILLTSDGKELNADTVTWDPNKRMIFAKQHVVLKTTKSITETDELESDFGFDKAVFTGQTNTVYQR